MTKNQTLFGIVGILALTAMVICGFYFVTKTDTQDRFSVSGSAVVYAKADIAKISIGVKTDVKKTAVEVTAENTKTINEIMATLTEDLGVESKDIKTTNYNLYPSYKWSEARGQELVGYEIYQELTIKVRDLEAIGTIIEKTTSAGANQVGDISFTIDDEYELKNEAREEAINKAKEKAQLIASQTGIQLGKLKGVVESASVPNIDPLYTNARIMKDMEGVGFDSFNSSPSIEVGQNEVRAEVVLIYQVK